MPEFVLNRNHSMRSLYGHIIDFKKGQPTYVPPICAREAASIGAECVDGKVDPLGPEAEIVAPMSPDERQENILAAFKLLEERNGRSDFTGNGVPATPALEKILGFDVDKKEINPLWAAYRAEQGAAE
jgi:hypothetical protein